jgi:hypothetical protein
MAPIEFCMEDIACLKCKSKAEVRYAPCPYPPFNMPGEKMCGKCLSYLGVQPEPDAWVYMDISVAERNPKTNPFEIKK